MFNFFKKLPFIKIQYFFILSFFIPFQINAQTAIDNFLTPGDNETFKKIVDYEPGQDIIVIEKNDGKIEIDKNDLTEELGIIVEFRDAPLFINHLKGLNSKLTKSSYQSVFHKFSNDLNQAHEIAYQKYKIQFKYPEIKREFFRIFNGVSIKITKAHLKYIQSLEYVKKIHKDKKMEKYLDHSIALIQADSVVKYFKTTGEGVVVGVVDTGIDYTHPALGGGYGPEYKVIGGYDIINDDSDPMDDNGHGTHVAGIIAANGDSIKGVDPGAQLMAFKVLDSNGGGYESDIIAGIERAIDPNMDGDLSDKVDIVNMSIGSYYGNPDDAVSTTVDNGVKAGVTFCIAAGNSGHFVGFNSIGSPGTSRLAITVGASDDFDKIAFFSSKGPNKKIYSIKPDVIAPGVNINSLASNGLYREASGTSMAAPHVAGVCALLKSIHQDWNPIALKSSLMTTAKDIGEEIMVQGSGRINAYKAASVKTIVNPAHLSFGLDQVDLLTWEIQDSLIVKNIDTTVKNYEIEISNLNAGVTISATPSQFSLSMNDSQFVFIKLVVDNNIVPYPLDGSLAFDSNIILKTDNETLHLPVAFVKASKLIMNFDKPNPDFFISSETYSYRTIFWEWDDHYTAELALPKGKYDLFFKCDGWLSKYFIIKENYNVEELNNLEINFAEAKNQIVLKGVNENGVFLSDETNARYNHRVVFPEESKYRSIRMSHSYDTVFVSDFSDRFKLFTGEIQYDLDNDNSIYVVQHEIIQGLNESIILQNEPDDFKIQNLNINLSHISNPLIHFYNTGRIVFPDYSWTVLFGMPGFFINTENWKGKLFITPSKHDNYQFTTALAVSERDYSFKNRLFDTKPFILTNDSIGCYYSYRPTPDVFLYPCGSEMEFGLSPIFTDVYIVNNFYGKSSFAIFPNFYGPLGERRDKDKYSSGYKIFDDNNNEIISDSLFRIEPIDLNVGRYFFKLSHSNYYIKDTQGIAKLEIKFDLGNDDPNPPRISSFKFVNSKNMISDHFEVSEEANLYFSVADYYLDENNYFWDWKYKSILIDSTHLFYKYHETDLWCELELNTVLEDSSIGFLFSSNLSELTIIDSTALDLKLSVYDQALNSTTWLIEPAFSVGNYVGATNIEKDGIAFLKGKNYRLSNNYPNPFNSTTLIKFEIPINTKVSLNIYDLLGCLVCSLVDQDLKSGEHSISWDGKNDSGSHVSSGIYFYCLKTTSFHSQKKMLLIR